MQPPTAVLVSPVPGPVKPLCRAWARSSRPPSGPPPSFLIGHRTALARLPPPRGRRRRQGLPNLPRHPTGNRI